MPAEAQSASTVLLVTASYDRTIRFWEALSGICSRTLQHPDSQVNRLAISADKRFLAAAGNPNVRIFDALTQANQAALMTFEGHTGNVTGVQFQSSCKWIVSSSEDGSLKIWDLRAGNSSQKGAQREYSHGKVGVADVVIHPNQVELISCDYGGSVRIWDLRSGTTQTASQNASVGACTHEIVPEEDAMMRSISIASDASLLTAGTHKGNVYFWKMVPSSMTMLLPQQTLSQNKDQPMWDVQAVTKIKAHDNYMLRSVLSPDVKHLATCSADSTIKIWQLNHPMDPSAAVNLPSEALQQVKNSQRLRVQQQQTTPSLVTLKKTLTGHSNWVWDCGWSADSEYLVSASSDHTARLWDLSSGQSIRQYQGHHKAAVCVCLNDFSLQS